MKRAGEAIAPSQPVARQPALVARLTAAVSRDGADWGLSPRASGVIILAPPTLAVLVAAAHLHRPLYRFLTGEDSVLEWTQVALILAAVAFLAVCVRAVVRRKEWAWAALFAIATLLAVGIAGEEVSWGQRLLGLETPPALEDLNTQGETNLHNIRGVLGTVNFAVMIGAIILAVLPLGVTVLRVRGRSLPDDLYRIVPPLALVTAFGIPAAYRSMRFITANGTSGSFAEMSELSLYLGVATFAFLLARRIGRTPPRARTAA